MVAPAMLLYWMAILLDLRTPKLACGSPILPDWHRGACGLFQVFLFDGATVTFSVSAHLIAILTMGTVSLYLIFMECLFILITLQFVLITIAFLLCFTDETVQKHGLWRFSVECYAYGVYRLSY